jgi:ankyrin repeat protein
MSLAKEQAISSENVWVVCEYFADTNIKDVTGNTALHYACKNNNKSVILALLLFGADTNLTNEEEKKPFDYSQFRDEEIEILIKAVEKYKLQFLQLTRKRRNDLRKIFEDMDYDQTKTINESKLKSFYEWLNDDNETVATEDAKLFIQETKLFRPEEV